MATNITTENDNSVSDYLQKIENDQRRKDCGQLVKIIQKETGLKAKMWGTAIVGFGSYHYTYESGRQGDAPLVAFSSRKNAIVLYISLTEEERKMLLKVFGKHKTTKGCIYIQQLSDID